MVFTLALSETSSQIQCLMKSRRFCFVLLMAVLSSLVISCDKADPDPYEFVNETTGGNTHSSISYESSSEPEGTIWFNMNSDLEFSYSVVSLYWCAPNNLKANYSMLRYGKVSGLNDINVKNVLPEIGWATRMACVPGYAYVIRYSERDYNTDGYTYIDKYLAIFVVDNLYASDGSVIGAKIKACPFTPGVGFNQ